MLQFLMVLILIHIQICLGDKLLQAQIIWGNGARNPTQCNWNCKYFKKKNLLIGNLTSTGMRQHYVLGVWMKDRYINQYNLLKEKFDEDEIYIFSTDYNYTILSAFSNMQGMFSNNGPNISQIQNKYHLPPNKGAEIFNDLDKPAIKYNIQVVPVHTIDETIDMQLFPFYLCKKAKEFSLENQQTIFAENIYSKSKNILRSLCKILNIKNDCFDKLNLIEYFETLYSSKYNNYHWPKLLNQTLFNKIDQLVALNIAIKFYQTWEQVKLLSTPFFDQLINFTSQALESQKNIKYLKYIAFSGHDLNIQLIAAALNLTSAECMAQVFLNQTVENENCIYTYPGYGSNIIFELWQEEKTNEKYIKVLYNGTEMNICNQKQTKCSYQIFKELLKNQRQDFYKNCLILEQKQNNTQARVSKLLITSIIFIIGLIFSFLCYGIILYKQIVRRKQYDQFKDIQSSQV